LTPQSYPLQWPNGWPREGSKEKGKFQSTLAGALAALRNEVKLMGGSDLVLSSNVTLGQDRPKDPAVVAYFTYQKMQVAIPCDRWQLVEHNVKAIALTIEAMRGMNRWGAKHMVRAMFTGFVALPAPSSESTAWWDVLEVKSDASHEVVTANYRRLAKDHHPDAGGTAEMMAKINAAYDEYKKERGL